MSIKGKVLTTIATAIVALTAANVASAHGPGPIAHHHGEFIVHGHDHIYFPPDYYYQHAHGRHFNDRQYLRMQERRKFKQKIRRLRRMYHSPQFERPIIIVRRPLY